MHNTILAEFPANYRLYEHIKTRETKDGKQLKSKNHAGGGHDRQDAYLYGHPDGRKKRYRSPAEFFPHLLWLAAQENYDRRDCSCKMCAPDDLQPPKTTKKTKAVAESSSGSTAIGNSQGVAGQTAMQSVAVVIERPTTLQASTQPLSSNGTAQTANTQQHFPPHIQPQSQPMYGYSQPAAVHHHAQGPQQLQQSYNPNFQNAESWYAQQSMQGQPVPYSQLQNQQQFQQQMAHNGQHIGDQQHQPQPQPQQGDTTMGGMNQFIQYDDGNSLPGYDQQYTDF
jgi:hypothetical protein